MPEPSRLRSLSAALKARIAQVLHVIDEALRSSESKERIWAAEQVLKCLKPADKKAGGGASRKKPAPSEDLSALSETELLERIRAELGGPDSDE